MIIGEAYTGPEVDVWSAGILLHFMLKGEVPFGSIAKVIECKFEMPAELSESCRDLLQCTFVRDRTRRIDIPGVLRHPWVMQNERRVVATLVTEPEPKRTKVSSSSLIFT